MAELKGIRIDAFAVLTVVLLMAGCVSQREYRELESRYYDAKVNMVHMEAFREANQLREHFILHHPDCIVQYADNMKKRSREHLLKHASEKAAKDTTEYFRLFPEEIK